MTLLIVRNPLNTCDVQGKGVLVQDTGLSQVVENLPEGEDKLFQWCSKSRSRDQFLQTSSRQISVLERK